MGRLLWVGLIAALAVLVWTRLRRPAVEPTAPLDSDAATIEHLRKAGSDVALPHEVEFFLYLPREVAARAVADRFGQAGFAADIHPSPSGPEWSCILRSSMVLTYGTLTSLRREFEEVTAAYGGEYDGWGAVEA